MKDSGNDPIELAIRNTETQTGPEELPESESENPVATGERGITLIFHSNGSIDIRPVDGMNDIGMMDLWAAAELLRIKGQEIYVAGMNEMRRQLEAQAKNDPRKRLVIAQAPLASSSHGPNN